MSSTLLQIVQAATGEMGLSVPASVVGNTQQDVVQQLALTNGILRDLLRDYEWQALSKLNAFNSGYVGTTGNLTNTSAVITNIPSTTGLSSLYNVTGLGIPTNAQILTVDSSTQVTLNQPVTQNVTGATLAFSQVRYSMPSDFSRQIDRTHWDKSQHWMMIGPETAQQWEWLTSGYISTGPRVRYRIFGSYFQIWPPQGVSHYLGFEYSSTYCVLATGGAQPTKTQFTADTDTCIFPDALMVNAVKHKYFQVKGFGDVYKADYDRELSIAKADDAGSQSLSMNPRVSGIFITMANLPDTGYGA